MRGACRLLWRTARRAGLAAVLAARIVQVDERSTRRSVTHAQRKVHDARLLTDTGFADVVNREFVGSQTWTPASILGHLHSTSRFSLAALGDRREDFERAVLGALGADAFPPKERRFYGAYPLARPCRDDGP